MAAMTSLQQRAAGGPAAQLRVGGGAG